MSNEMHCNLLVNNQGVIIVAQGSSFGPLFHLIYINDLANSVQDALVKPFADGTNLFIFDTKYLDLQRKANSTGDFLYDYR